MRSQRGFREDLGFHCDSKVEANFARILKYLGKDFQPYGVSRKKISIQDLGYKDENDGHILREMRPDFYLPKEKTFVEVKGGWSSVTSNDRKKLAGALLKGIKIVEICGITYEILEKEFKSKIREWEH
jgi:hypothetical protein